MRLTEIGEEFLRWLLKEDRARLEPVDFKIIENEYPFLNAFIKELATAQTREFVSNHKGPPFILFAQLPGFLVASMRHILVVLDCEDDWEAQQILGRKDAKEK